MGYKMIYTNPIHIPLQYIIHNCLWTKATNKKGNVSPISSTSLQKSASVKPSLWTCTRSLSDWPDYYKEHTGQTMFDNDIR